MNDTKRLDWLADQFGCALVNDDNGHWAFTGEGLQNVPIDNEPEDIMSSFYIEKKDWKNSIREAIDAAKEEASD